MRRRSTFTGTIAAAALAAAACVRGTGGGAGGAIAPSTVAEDVPALAAALRPNGKPLVVNHWATWCGPCVDELPYLAKVAARFEGRVDFVGVAWDRLSSSTSHSQAIGAADAVREKTGMRYRNVIAPPDLAAMEKDLELLSQSVPQTFVLSASGERLWSFLGEIADDTDQASFVAAIEKAIGP
jgi:thiol-disulfide isomerase/thioredoxin